ncbi:hypothetical protein D3C71_1742970 [compost metagenome]
MVAAPSPLAFTIRKVLTPLVLPLTSSKSDAELLSPSTLSNATTLLPVPLKLPVNVMWSSAAGLVSAKVMVPPLATLL